MDRPHLRDHALLLRITAVPGGVDTSARESSRSDQALLKIAVIQRRV
jgi:hypothetical protein